MIHLSRRGADDGERECTSHNTAHSSEVLHVQVLRCCVVLEGGQESDKPGAAMWCLMWWAA